MANTVELELLANTKKAISSINSFKESTAKSLKAITGSFSLLKTAAIGAVGIIAGQKLINGIKAVTEAAAIQEDAINQLNQALVASGQFTQETSEDFQAFASSLQQSSKFGDEVILQNAALIQSLGKLDKEGLKGATQAALDMAAALNIDLRSAATLVGKAAAGEIGSFSRYGVVIKKGADNSETFANALKAINQQFGGAAEAQINTYAGAVQQLENVQGDLLEVIGDAIIKNPIVTATVKAASEAFSNLITTVVENKEEIQDYVNAGLKAVLAIIPKIIRSLGFFVKAIEGISFILTSSTIAIAQFIQALLEFKAVTVVINTLKDVFVVLSSGIVAATKGFVSFLKLIPGSGAIEDALGVDFDSFIQGLDDIGQGLSDNLGEDVTVGISDGLQGIIDKSLNLQDTVSGGLEGIATAAETVATAADSVVNKVASASEKAKTATQKTIDVLNKEEAARKNLGIIAKEEEEKKANAAIAAADKTAKETAKIEEEKLKKSKETNEKYANAITTTLSSGFKGLVGGALGELTNSFLPGFGAAATEVFNFLGQDTAAFADNLKQIFNIDFVKNIGENLKTLFKELPNLIGPFIEGLLTELPKLGIEILRLLLNPEFYAKLAKGIFEGVVNGIKNALGAIVDGIKKAFTSVFDGAAGIVGKIGDFLGFQEGGIVPAGFPNDSFPAKLTSGELVVPKDDVKALRQFLNTQGEQKPQVAAVPDQNVNIVLQVGEKQLADIMLNLNRQGFRTA